MVEQVELARVDGGQKVSVQVGLRLLRWLVADAVLAEPLARPVAGVAVTRDLGDAVTFEQLRELTHHIFRAESRFAFTQRIKDDHIAFPGHDVIGSDLVDYGRPDCFWRRDFLLEHKLPDGCEGIVTNPPYKLVEQFVEHALDLCPRVIMLLRLAFYESERRCVLLEERGLARILVFRKRLPMMHRDGWEGRKGNSGMAFAWFVWDRAHGGPTTINRISWER